MHNLFSIETLRRATVLAYGILMVFIAAAPGFGTDLGQGANRDLATAEPTPWYDGTCPRGPGYWRRHANAWPATSMVVGGISYGQSDLLDMLHYAGPDASNRLCKHLVAAHLNLLTGTSPVIGATVDDANDFLTVHPPGSNPRGAERRYANALKKKLRKYNRNMDGSYCVTDDSFDPRQVCADRADGDAYGHYGGGHAIWIPGIGGDFVFDADPGSLQELVDGTAKLTGIAHRASDPNQAFRVDVTLTDRTSSAPPGSPKKELNASAYVDNGGPVDPSTWWYYREFNGTFTGLHGLSGAVLQVERRGPAFQVGDGASGKNIRHGGSGWFDWVLTQQAQHASLPWDGHGDFNLDLDGCRSVCIQRAPSDKDYLPLYNGQAWWFEHMGSFVFEQETRLVEYDSGEGRMIGTLRSKQEPNKRFRLEMRMAGHTRNAPAGSPYLTLPEVAYTPSGGPIEPASWRYYPVFYGSLIGEGDYEGAVIEFTRRGPAFQFGLGASGRNTYEGGSGWVDYAVVQQPHYTTLPASGRGDGTLSVCEPGPQADLTFSGQGCFPTRVAAYQVGVTGSGDLPEPVRRTARRALGAPQGNDKLNFVSLGYGGSITLAFTQKLLNGPGADFTLFETTYAAKTCNEYPVEAQVFVAMFLGGPWELVGRVCQEGAFDLGSLAWARYIRIEDMTDHARFFDGVASDGLNLDGVHAHLCQ